MARPRKSDIHSDNRREELILEAAWLFRQKGFKATSMRDIAAATHMHSGSPFYYFASKQDLLLAGVEQGLRDCLQALESIDAGAMSPADYLRQLVQEHLLQLLERRSGVTPLVLDAWAHQAGNRNKAIVDLRARYVNLWMRALQALRPQEFGRRAQRLECYFLLGALHTVHSWYRPEGALTPTQIADRFVDWLIAPAALAGAAPHPPVKAKKQP